MYGQCAVVDDYIAVLKWLFASDTAFGIMGCLPLMGGTILRSIGNFNDSEQLGFWLSHYSPHYPFPSAGLSPTSLAMASAISLSMVAIRMPIAHI